MSQSFLPEGSIQVADAEQMIANWKEYVSNPANHFHGHSFHTPIASFTNLLQFNPNAEAVRVYIGLETAGDPTSAKLIYIPIVDGHQVRSIEMPQGGGVGAEVSGGDGSQSNTYDLTNLCPPNCGTDEPPAPTE